jgi:hypothetical protein
MGQAPGGVPVRAGRLRYYAWVYSSGLNHLMSPMRLRWLSCPPSAAISPTTPTQNATNNQPLEESPGSPGRNARGIATPVTVIQARTIRTAMNDGGIRASLYFSSCSASSSSRPASVSCISWCSAARGATCRRARAVLRMPCASTRPACSAYKPGTSSQDRPAVSVSRLLAEGTAHGSRRLPSRQLSLQSIPGATPPARSVVFLPRPALVPSSTNPGTLGLDVDIQEAVAAPP